MERKAHLFPKFLFRHRVGRPCYRFAWNPESEIVRRLNHVDFPANYRADASLAIGSRAMADLSSGSGTIHHAREVTNFIGSEASESGNGMKRRNVIDRENPEGKQTFLPTEHSGHVTKSEQGCGNQKLEKATAGFRIGGVRLWGQAMDGGSSVFGIRNKIWVFKFPRN